MEMPLFERTLTIAEMQAAYDLCKRTYPGILRHIAFDGTADYVKVPSVLKVPRTFSGDGHKKGRE